MTNEVIINKMVMIYAQEDDGWNRTLVGILRDTEGRGGDGWKPEIQLVRNRCLQFNVMDSGTARIMRKHIVEALKEPSVVAGMLPADVPGWAFYWDLVDANVQKVPKLAIRREEAENA